MQRARDDSANRPDSTAAMQRTTLERDWSRSDFGRSDATDDRVRHPLRSRLQPPVTPAQAAVPQPKQAPTTRAAAAPRDARQGNNRSRRAGSAAGFGLLGFLFGAVFWHFVGFWDFVGQVMFKGKPDEMQIAQAPPPIKLKERVPGSGALAVVIEPAACTTLRLDRASGVTSDADCEPTTLPLRSLKVARREDMWVTAGQRIQQATARGWSSVTVERPDDRHELQANAD